MQDFNETQEMPFEYFTQQEADVFAFYMIPKELITNPRYKDRTCTDSKLLYGLLRDRNQLSLKNGWVDKEGHIFIIFTREEVEQVLGIGNQKANKLFKELNEVRLIREVRQGLNKPNIIYVGKIQPAKLEKCRRCENHISGDVIFTSQDIPKSHTSNTDNNKTYLSEKEISLSVCPVTVEDTREVRQQTDGQAEKVSQIKSQEKPKPHRPVCEVTESDIKQQIGYTALATLGDTSLLDEVVLNMLDMYHSPSVKIQGVEKPQVIIHSVLNKVTYWHIIYLLDRFKQITRTIKNKKDYLQTMIYNSVLEQQAHVENEYRTDQVTWTEKEPL